jgi:hypothetical protein
MKQSDAGKRAKKVKKKPSACHQCYKQRFRESALHISTHRSGFAPDRSPKNLNISFLWVLPSKDLVPVMGR